MNRLKILDLLRFLAAIIVVLFHYLFRGSQGDSYLSVNYDEIGFLFKYGYLGVQLFFIISGFVIFLSIEKKRPLEFVFSRARRLYPAYIIAVLMTSFFILEFGLGALNLSLSQILINITMFQKFLGVKDIDGVYWTLSYEIIFYFWCWVLISTRSVKNITFYIVIFLFISFMSKFFSFSKIFNVVFLTDYSCYFSAGIVFYLSMKGKVGNLKYLILTACIGLSIYQMNEQMDNLSLEFNSVFEHSASIFFILVSYSIFYGIEKGGDFFGLGKVDYKILGGLSYPIYLCHQNIGYILINQLSNFVNKWLAFTSAILLVIVLSFFLFLIERKTQRLLTFKR